MIEFILTFGFILIIVKFIVSTKVGNEIRQWIYYTDIGPITTCLVFLALAVYLYLSNN